MRTIREEFEKRRDRAALKAELEFRYDSIADILPYRWFDDDLYINDKSAGFILEFSPFCGADQSMIDTLTGMITDGIPSGCTIQFLTYASPDVDSIFDSWTDGKVNNVGIYKRISERRLEFYKEADWKSLFPASDFLIRNFRVFVVVSLPGVGDEVFKLLRNLKKQLSSTLNSMGTSSIEVEPEEFLKFLGELIYPGKKLESLEWDRLNPLNEQLALRDGCLEVEINGMKFGDIEARNYSVTKLPKYWAQWMNRDLLGDFYSQYLQIPCPFLYSVTVSFGNPEREKNQAITSHFNAMRKVSAGFDRFFPRVREIAKDWEFVTKKLDEEGQKLVKIHYGIVLYAKSEEMERCEAALKALYQSKNFEIQRCDYNQLQVWLGCLPFTFSEGLDKDFKNYDRLKNTVTWSVANIAPLQGEWKGMSDTSMLLFGRSGQPFGYNPFSNNQGNYNEVVAGRSGSGKSVYMQERILGILRGGGNVFVIDDGRSFENSCKILGGQFVEFSGDQKLVLNPFSFIDEKKFGSSYGIKLLYDINDQKQESYRGEVINLLKSIIGRMCKGGEELDRIEESYINQAIISVWEKKGKNAVIDDVCDYLSSCMDKRAVDLAIMMEAFSSRGPYGYMFNGPATLSLENSYTVFELRELQNKPDLQSVVFNVLVYMVTERMQGSRDISSALIVDEAWSFLKGGVGGTFIEGVARRARKYNGCLITGTQNISDFYQSAAAKAAFDNSDFKVFLSQPGGGVKVDEGYHMSEEQIKALRSLKMVDGEYSEAMFCTPNGGWAVGRLILDSYSLALYSSKGTDVEQIKKYRNAGYSLEDAVEKLAEEKRRRK